MYSEGTMVKVSSKIAFVILFMGASFFLTNYLAYKSEYKTVERLVMNQLKSVASIQKSRVENINKQNRERFKLVASRTQLRLSLRNFLKTGDKASLNKIQKILKDAKNSIENFSRIDIVNFEGNIIATSSDVTPQITSVNISNAELLKQYRDTIIFTFSKTTNDSMVKNIEGTLSLDDKALAFMVIESRTGGLQAVVSDYTGLGKTGETVLAIQEKDSSFIFLAPTRFNKNAALNLKISKTDTSIAMTQVFKGNEQFLSQKYDYRNHKIWAVPKVIDGERWGMIVKVDIDEILSPIRNKQKEHLLVSLAAVIIILISLVYVFLSIARPIKTLTSQAIELSKGNYKIPLKMSKSKDEIGLLNKAFNTMSQNIIISHNHLTSKISELNSEISDRIKAETALQSSEERFKDLFIQSPIGLALCKMDGQLVSVNPAYASIIGYTINEVLKLSYWDVTPQKYEEDEKKQLEKLNAHGKYGPYEKEYIHKDGTLIPVRLNGMIVSRDGEEFIWSSVEDISDLRKSEKEKTELFEQLRQSHKMEAIGTLAGGIAHDFNNILSAILGYSDLALQDSSENNDAKKHIEEIISAGNRAKELVKQILSFSRKETSKYSPVKVTSVLKEVIKLLRASTPSSIKIVSSISEESGSVIGDATELHQVILNVCTNGAQAIGESRGTLKISLKPVVVEEKDIINEETEKTGVFECLTITDDGIGISPENIEKIFDPYFTTKQTGKGTGMGLAVVSGIIKSYDGFVRVHSKVNEGTSIKLFLPQVKGVVAREISEDIVKPKGCERILFIDDESMLVDVTKLHLEKLGYLVTGVTSSVKGVEIFIEDPDKFDLVITDFTMPEMNGEEVAKKILKASPNTPVIMCSGYNNKIDSEAANQIGISLLMMKPVNYSYLAKNIREILDNVQ